MRDHFSGYLPDTARHRSGAHATVRRALAAATMALPGMIAACSSATSQPPTSVHPAVPARSSVFATIPPACSLLNSRTLSQLGLAAKGQQRPSAQETGLTEEYCTWTSRPGNPVSPTVTIIVDLFTAAYGQAPAVAAQQQFQNNVSEQAQADGSRASRVRGLADEAFINQVTRGSLSQSQVQVLDQNVLLTLAYGEPASSESISAPLSDGALTAARAILTTLGAS
jgi:hypothetical protein